MSQCTKWLSSWNPSNKRTIMDFSYFLYGKDDRRISYEQLLAEQRRDGMLYARAEQPGCEGFSVEVARWSETRWRWERYALHKFLDGDDPQFPSCTEAVARHFAKEINQAGARVVTPFSPIIARMPDWVDKTEEGPIDEDGGDTEFNVPCVACGREYLPLPTNRRCGAFGPGPTKRTLPEARFAFLVLALPTIWIVSPARKSLAAARSPATSSCTWPRYSISPPSTASNRSSSPTLVPASTLPRRLTSRASRRRSRPLPTDTKSGALPTAKHGDSYAFHTLEMPRMSARRRHTGNRSRHRFVIFDESGQAEHQGETKLDWNGQTTRHNEAGKVILERPEGHQWPADRQGLTTSPSIQGASMPTCRD